MDVFAVVNQELNKSNFDFLSSWLIDVIFVSLGVFIFMLN
jgi:hypothetical protein